MIDGRWMQEHSKTASALPRKPSAPAPTPRSSNFLASLPHLHGRSPVSVHGPPRSPMAEGAFEAPVSAVRITQPQLVESPTLRRLYHPQHGPARTNDSALELLLDW
jgi:hypothetical protein